VVLESALCAYAIILFLVGLYNAALLLGLGKVRFDALSTSLVFAISANACTAMVIGSNIRLPLGYPPSNASGRKADGLRIGPVTQALMFLFATFSYLNLSLVWIEIAENAHTLHESSPNIKRYRKAEIVYYIIFFGLVLCGAILERSDLAIVPASFGVLIVSVTFVIGYFKMREMTVSLLGPADGAWTGEGTEMIRFQLHLIQNAALGVTSGCVIFMVNAGVWISSGGFTDRPGANLNLVPYSLLWFGASIANGIVMQYLFTTIRLKRKASGSSAAVAASGILASKSAEAKDIS
jgi:hypothetical protein